MVVGLRARDPKALAAVLDTYAGPLYGYVYSMLRSHSAASDVLYDVLAGAGARIDELDDPTLLRCWLYALARDEWLPRRGHLSDEDVEADPADDPGPKEPRWLAWCTGQILDPDAREILELSARHQLVGTDLAVVLGTSTEQADLSVAQAQEELRRAFTTALMSRDPSRCPGLAAVLEDWDGRPVTLPRGSVDQHIEDCATCAERRPAGVSVARLVTQTPLPPMPRGLRERVLDFGGAPTGEQPRVSPPADAAAPADSSPDDPPAAGNAPASAFPGGALAGPVAAGAVGGSIAAGALGGPVAGGAPGGPEGDDAPAGASSDPVQGDVPADLAQGPIPFPDGEEEGGEGSVISFWDDAAAGPSGGDIAGDFADGAEGEDDGERAPRWVWPVGVGVAACALLVAGAFFLWPEKTPINTLAGGAPPVPAASASSSLGGQLESSAPVPTPTLSDPVGDQPAGGADVGSLPQEGTRPVRVVPEVPDGFRSAGRDGSQQAQEAPPQQPAPAPTRTRTRDQGKNPPPPEEPGELRVSPNKLDLVNQERGTQEGKLTLRAVSGDVHWEAFVPEDAPRIYVDPSSRGVLSEGRTLTVTVTLDDPSVHEPGETTITFVTTDNQRRRVHVSWTVEPSPTPSDPSPSSESPSP